RVILDHSTKEEIPGITGWSIPGGLFLLMACVAALLKLPGFASVPGMATFYLGLFGFGLLVTGWSAVVTKTGFSSRLLDWGSQFPSSDDPEHRVSVSWVDCYATHDPVSNGPAFFGDKDYVRKRQVSNLGSFLLDHTSYWKNADQFVASVATDVAALGGINFQGEGGAEAMKVADMRRTWRVRTLSSVPMVLYVLGALALILHRRELQLLGNRCLQYASAMIASLHLDFLTGLFHPFATYGAWAAGAIAILAPILVVQQLLYRLWTFWNWTDTRCFFTSSSCPFTLSWPFAVYMEASVVAAAAALCYALEWTTGLWRAGGEIVGVGVRAGLVTLTVMVIRVWRRQWKAWRRTRKRKRPSRSKIF